MTDLPEWVKALRLKSPRYGERESGVIYLKGSGTLDLGCLLVAPWPPGYRLAKVNGTVEHKRGDRFTWQVLWVKEEVAERRYQDKQAALLSRYEVQT